MLDREGQLELTLDNRGTAAAHFAIYSYAGEFEHPLHVDVRGRHSETFGLPADAYRVAVQGPNQFWYELAGSRSGVAAHVDVRTRTWPCRGDLVLVVENLGDTSVTLELRALNYRGKTTTHTLRPRRRRSVEWPTDHGWYDIEITASDDSAFRRRLIGRIEDNGPGVSA